MWVFCPNYFPFPPHPKAIIRDHSFEVNLSERTICATTLFALGYVIKDGNKRAKLAHVEVKNTV
jgi:hypothetical protein